MDRGDPLDFFDFPPEMVAMMKAYRARQALTTHAPAPADDGRLHVKLVGLEHVEPCDHPTLLAAIGLHLGLEPMTKAVQHEDEGPDPRFPKLARLVELAQADWHTWIDQLVEAVAELAAAGKLSPLNEENENVLRALFADHEAALVLRFTGRGDALTVQRLVDAGLVHPSVASRAWIPTAYKLGAAVSALRVHPDDQPPSRATIEQLLATVEPIRLTQQQRRASEAVARRGEIYMRRPAMQLTNGIWQRIAENERMWNPAELQQLRDTTAKAVEQRKGAKELARDLRDVVNGNPSMQNDMDRVARTELCLAHGAAAYSTLKQQASQIGMDDPLVCKLVSPRACTDCKRIWGLPSDPIPYRLSFIEAREAAGGNFRLPHASWGPVVGPVHPNCTEGALLLYDPRFVKGANANAARVKP
jgi:hypothetical protein